MIICGLQAAVNTLVPESAPHGHGKNPALPDSIQMSLDRAAGMPAPGRGRQKSSSKKAQKSDPVGGRFLKEAREGRYRRRETLGAVSLLEISREMSVLLERD